MIGLTTIISVSFKNTQRIFTLGKDDITTLLHVCDTDIIKCTAFMIGEILFLKQKCLCLFKLIWQYDTHTHSLSLSHPLSLSVIPCTPEGTFELQYILDRNSFLLAKKKDFPRVFHTVTFIWPGEIKTWGSRKLIKVSNYDVVF